MLSPDSETIYHTYKNTINHDTITIAQIQIYIRKNSVKAIRTKAKISIRHFFILSFLDTASLTISA